MKHNRTNSFTGASQRSSVASNQGTKRSTSKTRTADYEDGDMRRSNADRLLQDHLADRKMQMRSSLESRSQENDVLIEVIRKKEEEYRKYFGELERQYADVSTKLKNAEEKKNQVQRLVWRLREDSASKIETLKELEKKISRTLQSMEETIETKQEMERVQRENDDISKKLNSLNVILQEAQAKAHELEARTSECYEKMSELKEELDKRDAEILYAEGEYSVKSKKMNEQACMIQAFEQGSAETDTQKKQLAIEVEHIRIENEDLKHKFDLMTSLNTQKLKDQENIVQLIELELMYRLKSLAARNLAKKLQVLVVKNKKQAMTKLNLYVYKNTRKATAAISFSLLMQRIVTQSKKTALQALRNSTLIWTKCNEINEALTEEIYKRRAMQGAYLNWRDEFGAVLADDLRFSMATSALEKVLTNENKYMLKRGLIQWQKQAHFQKRVRVFLRHLFWRGHISDLRTAFNRWIFNSFEDEAVILRETYEQEMFKIKTLYSTFSQLKRNREVHKMVKAFRLRVIFNSWKRWFRDQKNIYRLERFFEVRNRARLRLKIQSIWANWKQESIKTMVNNGKEAIQGVNERNREIITQHIDVTRKFCLDNRIKSVRMLYSLLTTKPRKYFLKWRAFAQYKTSIFRKAANKWFFSHKESLLHAFTNWRVWAYKETHTSISNVVNTQISEINSHYTALEAHKRRLEGLQADNRIERVSKLGKLLKYIDNRLLRRGFNTYRSQYRAFTKKEQRVETLCKVLNHYFLRHGFDSLKSYDERTLWARKIFQKLKKGVEWRIARAYRKYLEAWKTHSAMQKRLKSIMVRLDLKIDFFLIRKKFNQWRRDHVKELAAGFHERNTDLQRQVSIIHENIKQVRTGNEDLNEDIEERKETSRRVAMRVWNYLYLKDTFRIQKETLYKWRYKTGYISKVEKLYQKLGRLIERKNKRVGFSHVSGYIFGQKMTALQVEIDKMTEQKKQLRLNIGAMTTSRSQESAVMYKEIETLEYQIAMLKKRKESLVESFARRNATNKTNRCYNECFMSWKKLYQARKNSLLKLDTLWGACNVKRVFMYLKTSVQEEKILERNNRLMRKVILCWLNRKTIGAFQNWKHQARLHAGHEDHRAHLRVTEDLSIMREKMEAYKKKQEENMGLRRKMLRTKAVFNEWKNWLGFKKSQKVKVVVVKRKLEDGTKRRIMQAIQERAVYQKRLKRFENRLKKFATKTLEAKYFKNLKEYMKIPKLMERELLLLVERVQLHWKSRSLQKLLEHKTKTKMTVANALDNMCYCIQNALRESEKLCLLEAFGEIEKLSQERTLKGRIFFNKMVGLNRSIVAKAFRELFFHSKLQGVVSKNKIMGPQAEENLKLISKVQTMRKFFQKEGYMEEDMGQYIREQNKERLLRNHFKRSLLQNNPENTFVLHKTFARWKKYVRKNQALKKFVRLYENYSTKPDLYHGFAVWKNLCKETLQAPKSHLIEMLKEHTEQVKKLNAEKMTRTKALSALETQHRQYAIFQPGIKKIAVRTFTRAFYKSIREYVEKWKMHVERCKDEEYKQLLEGANQKIVELENLVFVKHEAIRMLQEENKNIRDVCFEGTKTAKELKALMDERDRVSLSLTDKVAYIQELIQENANLNKRIATAQQEAIQLLALTKQFTGEGAHDER